MAACPVDSPQWRQLVAALGENDAKIVFAANDFEVPSLEEAKELLADILNGKSGPEINKATSEWRKNRDLERANSQIATLDRIISTLKPNQKNQLETLKKLKANLERYKSIVDNNEFRISVSRFFAGGELEDSELYKNYADFGTFLHFVVESIQKEFLNTNKRLTTDFTKQKLKSLLAQYNKNFYIRGLIENGTILQEDDLFNMTNDILGILNSEIAKGNVMLPEITVVGRDENGNAIIGRLDIAVIDSTGAVKIIDLKSKKLKSHATVDILNRDYDVATSTDANKKFATGKRTTYENWDIQLAIYARMLEQAGIDVSEKQILMLGYEGTYFNPDGVQFLIIEESEVGNYPKASVTKIVKEDGTIVYNLDTFKYVNHHIRLVDSSLDAKTNEDARLRFIKNMKNVKAVLPYDKEQESIEPETPEQEAKRKNIFGLSNEQADELVKKIQAKINEEIKTTSKKLAEQEKSKADENAIKLLKTRKEDLERILQIINKDNTEWHAPYKLGLIIEHLSTSVQDMKGRVNTLSAEISKSTIDFKNNRLFEIAKELDDIRVKASGYNFAITRIKTLLFESLDTNDKAFQILQSLEKEIDRVNAAYSQLGFKFLVHTMKSDLTQRQAEKIDDERKRIIGAQIKVKKQEIDQIKNGTQGVVKSIWDKALFFGKNLVNEALGRQSDASTRVQQLEIEIENLEQRIQGVEMTDDQIKDWILSILNPDSLAYLGSETSWFTQISANSSSGDRTIAAFSNQLKLAQAEATQNYMNFVEKNNLQKEVMQYQGSLTDIPTIHQPIAEITRELEIDENGNQNPVQRRSFVNPLSEEYRFKFDVYRHTLKKLNEEIRTHSPNSEKRKELVKQRTELINEFTKWRLQNTQMEYVPQFYKILELLPNDYVEKRNELYEQIRDIESRYGFNSLEQLSEEEIEELNDLKIQLKKLKKEYAERIDKEGYTKYLDLLDQFYDYDINYDYYNRLKEQKRIELTDSNNILNQAEFKKWVERNTIKRPNQKWFDDIGEIYEGIFSILGRNPNVQKLQDDYKNIINQYRVSGVIDSRFISQQDIDTMQAIDDTIEGIKDQSNSVKLNRDEREALTALFKRLETLKKDVENPYYQADFAERLETLDKKWQLYKDATNPSEKKSALDQFVIEELEFKTWYDNNHKNKYISRLSPEYKGLSPKPKKFNTIAVPTDESYLEEIPNEKFGFRRIKDVALNPEFQLDATGRYPMPAGLSRSGAKIDGNSPWLNSKYAQLRQIPRVADFYHSFVGRFLDAQEGTTGYKLGYNFPGFEEKSLQTFKSQGIKEGFKTRRDMLVSKYVLPDNIYDTTINNYYSNDDRIRLKHNRPLPINQQSQNGIAAVIMWFEEAHMNKALLPMQIPSNAMLFMLDEIYRNLLNSNMPEKEKQERLVALKRVIDEMNFSYKKLVQGQYKKDEGQVGRTIDNVLSVLSITRLGFDIPNQIGNMVSGNIQAFLGANPSRRYSTTNLKWAKGKIYDPKEGLIASFIKDYDKISNKSFITKMYMYFNPQQDSLKRFFNRNRSRGERLTQGFMDFEPAFWIQDKGEIEIAATIWLSIMDNHKLQVVKSWNQDGSVNEYEKDADGNIKIINAYDAYTTNKFGELIIREDVAIGQQKYTKADEAAIMKTVWSEVRRTQGNYADWDRTSMEAGWKGRVLSFFRRYLYSAIRNRIGKLQTDWEAGEMAMGTYRAFAQAAQIYSFKDFIYGMFGSDKSEMDPFYRARVQQTAIEMTAGAMLYMLGHMLLALIPDEDDDDYMKKLIAYNLLAVYAKADRETRSLLPIPIIGGLDEYITNLSSFTNAGRDVSRVFKTLEHGLYLGGAQIFDSEWIQKGAYYQRKTGIYNKGDAKITKDLVAITPYMNLFDFFSPEEKITNYKRSISF